MSKVIKLQKKETASEVKIQKILDSLVEQGKLKKVKSKNWNGIDKNFEFTYQKAGMTET